MKSIQTQRRLPTDAGIAIGPILFVIALLGILGAVIAAGNSDFGTASVADRVTADVTTQANLIRAKINECNLLYGTNSNYDGFPDSGGAPVLVSDLVCAGDPSTGAGQNLWTGQRATSLPQPTKGMGSWYYINTNTTGLGGLPIGGRCIYAVPTGSNPSGDNGLVVGLTKAASKFSNGTTFSSSNEVLYDPASSSQKFVVWISMPSGGTPDSHCVP
jgi:hypothetical protein